jgi:hypothetical protein
MTRAELLALAERVEKAQADQQAAIMYEVVTALHLYSTFFRLVDQRAFLEIAASLVPDWIEGWVASFDAESRSGVTTIWGGTQKRRGMPRKRLSCVATAATPALALTAAALRAMAEEAGDE